MFQELVENEVEWSSQHPRQFDLPIGQRGARDAQIRKLSDKEDADERRRSLSVELNRDLEKPWRSGEAMEEVRQVVWV